jgi:hypothetical protein
VVDARANAPAEALDIPDKKTAAFREMAEALTALGFYLETVCRELKGQDQPGPEVFRRIRVKLEKGLAQHDRASKAIHRLREPTKPASGGFV